MRGVLALRLSADEKAALMRAASAKGVALSVFVREAALRAAVAPASTFDVRDPEPAVTEPESDQEVPQSLEEILAKVWGPSVRPLRWWEKDAAGIPQSEDYWAWRRRTQGH
jgi:hypothetical protein